MEFNESLKYLQSSDQDHNESKVGKKLSESTQKAVITLVLTMLLSSAFLQLNMFIDNPLGYNFGLQMISEAYQTGDQAVFNETLSAYMAGWKNDQTPLIYIECGNFTEDYGINRTDYRSSELEQSLYELRNGNFSLAIYDKRSVSRLSASLGIVTTLFICIILAAGSLMISKVTQELVLDPIENMIQKVKQITENPIKAAQEAEEELVKEEELNL